MHELEGARRGHGRRRAFAWRVSEPFGAEPALELRCLPRRPFVLEQATAIERRARGADSPRSLWPALTEPTAGEDSLCLPSLAAATTATPAETTGQAPLQTEPVHAQG